MAQAVVPSQCIGVVSVHCEGIQLPVQLIDPEEVKHGCKYPPCHWDSHCEVR